MSYDGEPRSGELLRLPCEDNMPADSLFTERDRNDAQAALQGKKPIEPVSKRLSYLAKKGVYAGEDSQAAIYLRQIEGIAGYPKTPDL